jgi:mannose-6-phosphate isomerase-like protein (cupin superfamily)
MKFVVVFAVVLLVVPVWGQTKKSDIFTATDIKAKVAILEQKAKISGSGGVKLDDYGSHSIGLSVRNTSGGAEVHAHYDDIFLVTRGEATLVTGGTVVDAKTGPDGETHGSKLSGGILQKIKAGDVVNIPAGMPHQVILAHGALYSAIVVKVKEN